MRSDFLFAQPSLLSGFARTLDIGASFDGYNSSATPEEADARATFSDWSMVGRDLSQAMAAFKAEHDKTEQ